MIETIDRLISFVLDWVFKKRSDDPAQVEFRQRKLAVLQQTLNLAAEAFRAKCKLAQCAGRGVDLCPLTRKLVARRKLMKNFAVEGDALVPGLWPPVKRFDRVLREPSVADASPAWNELKRWINEQIAALVRS